MIQLINLKKEDNQKHLYNLVSSLVSKLICEIVFTKKDGSIRKMKCTNNQIILLQEDKKFSEWIIEASKKEPSTFKLDKKPNYAIIRVWDMENSGWRMITLNKITKITIL